MHADTRRVLVVMCTEHSAEPFSLSITSASKTPSNASIPSATIRRSCSLRHLRNIKCIVLAPPSLARAHSLTHSRAHSTARHRREQGGTLARGVLAQLVVLGVSLLGRARDFALQLFGELSDFVLNQPQLGIHLGGGVESFSVTTYTPGYVALYYTPLGTQRTQ